MRSKKKSPALLQIFGQCQLRRRHWNLLSLYEKNIGMRDITVMPMFLEKRMRSPGAVMTGSRPRQQDGPCWMYCMVQGSTMSDYPALGKIQYIAGNMEVPCLDSVYTDSVETTWLVREDQKAFFIKKLTEATSGQADIVSQGQCFAALSGRDVILL